MSAEDPDDNRPIGDDGELHEPDPATGVDWYGDKIKRGDPRLRQTTRLIAITALLAACLSIVALVLLLTALGVLQPGTLLCRLHSCSTATATRGVALYITATPNPAYNVTIAPTLTPSVSPSASPTFTRVPVTLSPTPSLIPTNALAGLCYSRNGGFKERIVFASDRNGQREVDPFDLYVMDTDGTNVCRLTTRGGSDPSVSPDGETIAFVSQRSSQWEIFYMPVRDHLNSQVRVTNGPLDSHPMWEPNTPLTKNALVFTADPQQSNHSQLYITGIQQGAKSYLMSAPGQADKNFSGQWSPDSKNIVFASTRDGSTDIYVMDFHFANLRRLTASSGSNTSPVWSPDGQRIAFVSSRASNLNIYVMNADGSQQQALTSGSAISAQPRWSPDGTRLVFMSDRDGNQEIYTMTADGSNVRRLTNAPGKDIMPDWSPCVDVPYQPAQCPPPATATVQPTP